MSFCSTWAVLLNLLPNYICNQSNATSESFLKLFWLFVMSWHLSLSHPKLWPLACNVLQLWLSGGLDTALFYGHFFMVENTLHDKGLTCFEQQQMSSPLPFAWLKLSLLKQSTLGTLQVGRFHDSEILVKYVPVTSNVLLNYPSSR